jgi:hypothetical protein
MEIHPVFLHAALARGFLGKFARCDSRVRSLARSLARSLRDVSKDLLLILRPKRLPSLDYDNVALLQVAVRSLRPIVIGDTSDPTKAIMPFCLDGHYRHPRCQCECARANGRYEAARFASGQAINHELIKLAAIVLGNRSDRDRSVNRSGDEPR